MKLGILIITLIVLAHQVVGHGCDIICPIDVHDPVCGSDGQTYNNLCEFEKAKRCENKLHLIALHYGTCENEIITGKKPNCTSTTISCLHDPLCGSDYQMYDNECQLCAVISKQRDLDPNFQLNILRPGNCLLTPDCTLTYPIAECPKEGFPLCGSDGRTYTNVCQFCKSQHQWKNIDVDLTVVHEGVCSPLDYCPPSSKDGICPFEYSPVCADDGKTYSSVCTLCTHIYEQNNGHLPLSIDYYGECKPKSIGQLNCTDNQDGTCEKDYHPLCGSDGKTYTNECEFCYAKQDSHKNGLELNLVNSGECKTRQKRKTGAIWECEKMDFAGTCSEDGSPVCASDGSTYRNKCAFCRAKHQKEVAGEGSLEITNQGPCNQSPKRSIPIELECWMEEKLGLCSRELEPLCGSDSKTYGNKCTFCHATVRYQRLGKELRLSHVGECRPRMLQCHEMSKYGACTYEMMPVCGSDGQTYDNECGLCVEQHRRQKSGENVFLYIKHDGVCGPP